MRVSTAFAALLASVLLAGCSVRSTHEFPLSGQGDPAAVLAAEDAMYAALVQRDTAALAFALAPDFVLSGSAPELETRTQYLATAIMPGRMLEPIELADRRVRIYGHTAVVTGRSTFRGTLSGRAFSISARYTNVYLSREGRWQAVAAHLSTLE